MKVTRLLYPPKSATSFELPATVWLGDYGAERKGLYRQKISLNRQVDIIVPVFDKSAIFRYVEPSTGWTLVQLMDRIYRASVRAGKWDARYHPEHYRVDVHPDGSDFVDEFSIATLDISKDRKRVYVQFEH